jgi:hypothetical protein
VTPLLTQYINIARVQVAVDGECVRTSATLSNISPGTTVFQLTDMTLPPASGYAQAIVLRAAYLGTTRVDIRPWDWFVAYHMNQPATPTPVMAQQQQGSWGTFWINGPGGNMWADVVALPEDLPDDTTFADAIPYPWSDAVPFYACYYAYMAFQRQADANIFMERYRDLMRRARGEATSTNLPDNDPGGMGALVATAKTALGAPPPQPPQRGR